MGLSKEVREGLIRMGLDPDKGFISGEELKQKAEERRRRREQERKAKEASNASVSKKKRV